MADSQEAVRRLTITSTNDGSIPKTTADLNDLAKAQGNVAVASSTTEKATQSLDQKFASIERRYVAQVRAQQDYEKVQRQVNAAVQQNPALQDRANAVLAAAKDRHDQLANSQKALGVITADLTNRVQAQAGSFGVVGSALTALGPVGLGVAAVIGTVIAAFNIASDAAHNLAEKAKALREFAESTGLTTQQVQALNAEAGKFGIDSEALASGLQKFTSGFQQLRLGTGDLLTQIRRINPALAEQMLTAQDAATAFTLFGQAVSQTDGIFQRNALLKAGLGKGSAIFGGLFDSAPDVAGLAASFAAAGKGIDDNLIKRLATLQVEINKAKGAAEKIFASTFAEQTLSEEKQYADMLVSLATAFKSFMDSFSHPPEWITQFLRIAQTGSFDPATQARRMLTNGLGAGAQSSSSAQAVSDAVPRTGTYDSIKASQFIGPAAPPPKTPQAQLADMERTISQLGAAATASEKLALAYKKLELGQDGLTLSGNELARARSALKLDSDIAQVSAHNSALGAAASVSDVLKAKTLELAKAQQQGAGLSQEQINRQLQMTAAQSSGVAAINAQVDAEKVRGATLFMSTEAALAYSIAQTEINKQLASGRSLQDINVDGIRAGAAELARTTVQVDKYADALRTAKDLGASFANDLIAGLLSGKSGMEALTAAANNLGKSLTTAGVNNIIKDPTSAVGYIEAGVGIVTQLVTGNTDAKKALEEAQKAWAKMADQVVAFNRAAAGFDLGPLTQQIMQLSQTESGLMDAAGEAHDAAGQARIAATFNTGVTRIVDQFKRGAEVLSPLQTAINGVNDEYRGLYDTLKSLHLDSLTVGLAESAQAQIRKLIQQFTDQLTSNLSERLNAATGKTYLTDASNLLKQHQTDIASAAELGNDPAVLAQISAVFSAEAQKIVEDAGLVGDSFNDFVKQFPELAGVVNQSSTALQDANDKFKALTDTINQYLDSLKLGSNSVLSPQDQLAAAQDQFNRQLGLAQGGDQTALGSITQYASALLDQAKSFYASSGGYTDIYRAVTSQLGDLTGGGPATGFATPQVSSPGSMTGISSSILPQVTAPRAASNDNGQLFQQQTSTLVQAFASVGNAQIQALREEVASLRAQNERLIAAVQTNRPKMARPAQRTGTNG